MAFTCVGINAAFIALAWLGRSWGTTILLGVMLVLAFAGLGALYNYRRTHRALVVSRTKEGATRLTTSDKIIDLAIEVETEEKKN